MNMPFITRFPQFDYHILVTYFTGVTNSKEIRSQLLAANSSYEYAFISGNTVISMQQILAATYRAINDFEDGYLRTRNLHSEIVFCLSPNNNIMDALSRFGISDTTSNLVAIKVIRDHGSDMIESAYEFLQKHVEGTETGVSDENLQKGCDVRLLQKNYRISAKETQIDLNDPGQLSNVIISMISLRGFQ